MQASHPGPRWLMTCVSGVLLLFACGSEPESSLKLFPVRGKLSVDGKPADGAIVTLWAINPAVKFDRVPTGYVQPDGTFAVGTTGADDGVPVGEYEVSVAWLPPDARHIFQTTGKIPASLIARKYNDPKKSGLKLIVKEEDNIVPEWQLTAK